MSRKRLLVLAVLAAVLIAGIVAWWGRPQMGEGSVYGSGENMTWADDGVDQTRMVVRDRSHGDPTATFSIRNDGRLPFTVHDLDDSGEDFWFAQQRVAFKPGIDLSDSSMANADPEITLAPGEEATVLWAIDMTTAPSMAEGDIREIDTFRFTVSWLGIPATRELRLPKPITFVGPM
ncbi:hypothetical protein FB565_000470 [Actinoplanes lutulentus]|nr:hypothetical protein [Actinoplanes lutulentus]MBB2940766.1 hypothetical protein [Actinoplanes lutulentus]